MTFYSLLFALFTVVLVGMGVGSRLHWVQTLAMASLAKKVGLGVPRDLDPMVRERVAARWLGYALGGAVGVLLPVAAFTLAGLPFERLEAWTTIAAVGTGGAIGTAVASVRAESRRPSTVRMARLRVVTIGDYVVPSTRVLAWIILPLAAACTVGAVVSLNGAMTRARFTALIVPAAALLVVGLIGLVAFEVAARQIVGRGQPAASTDELVWDDALRSTALRDLLIAPMVPLMVGAATPFLGVARTEPNPATILLPLLLIGTYAFFGFITKYTRTWYLEELWPGARRRTPDEEEARLAEVAAK